MRYSAFLLLGLLLIGVQGELYLIIEPLVAKGFRPSLLVPLLVYVGVTETNLALGACVAFILGYVLDVVGGAPIGMFAFISVATLALARLTGLRIVTQGGWARAALAGAFAAFGSVIAIVLFAIFGKGGHVPRAMIRQIFPHAIATGVASPLIYRIVGRTQSLVRGFLDPGRTPPRVARRGAALEVPPQQRDSSSEKS